MDEALNNLATLFPSLDKAILEEVYVATKKDFDKTVDQLLSMGVELDVDKRDQKNNNQAKPAQPHQPAPSQSQYQPSQHQPQQQQQYYPAPGSPHYHQPTPYHQEYKKPVVHTPTPIPPLTAAPLVPSPANPPTAVPTPTHLVSSGYQPSRMDMFNVPATPPPINSISPSPSAPTPTAPPASKLNESQSDQKRLDTVKQELALEYQRISEKHKYNLELQQKLEQLSEFTSSEQRKLEEQRAAFAEEKRRFTEELSNRFKSLQEDFARQKGDLQSQEEQRLAAAEAQAEATRQVKEAKRVRKAEEREEAERIRMETEAARQAEIESLVVQLEEERNKFNELQQEHQALKHRNGELHALKENAEIQIEDLENRVKNLQTQLQTTEAETSAEVLSYFSSVVSTLAHGIHAVSLERANNPSQPDADGDQPQPLQQLKKTFFRTVNESFNNKLKELDS